MIIWRFLGGAILGSFLFCHCASKHSNIQSVQQFIGMQINDRENLFAPPRLIIYFAATRCNLCTLRSLEQWNQEIRTSQISTNRILFIFHTTPIHKKSICSLLKASRFSYPILIDTVGTFERANPHLPSDPLFHTFLLDRDNRVVLVGSPIGNPKMWELYKSTIARLVENGGTLPPESSDGE